MIEISELTAMDEDEFEAAVSEHMGDPRGWKVLSDRQLVRRTLIALDQLATVVEGQLAVYDDRDPKWRPKAEGFQRLIKMRQRHANNAIHQMEGSHVQRERKWKQFAQDIALELDKSDRAHTLDDIQAPYGDICAGEWLDARLEKRAAGYQGVAA